MHRVRIGAALLILFGGLTILLVIRPGLATPTRVPGTPNFSNPDSICDTREQSCRDYISQLLRESAPTPYPADPRVRSVLLADPAAKAMIGNGQEGTDYWLDINPIHNARYGDEGALVTIVFAKPVSYDGPATSGSEPCKGHTEEGKLKDPTDPCAGEPREFSEVAAHIAGVRLVFAQVDVPKATVFNPYGQIAEEWEIQDILSRLAAEPLAPLTATPEVTVMPGSPTVIPQATESR